MYRRYNLGRENLQTSPNQEQMPNLNEIKEFLDYYNIKKKSQGLNTYDRKRHKTILIYLHMIIEKKLPNNLNNNSKKTLALNPIE